MGEYVPVTVQLGGKLNASAVPELIRILEDQGFWVDDEGPTEANLGALFRAEEVNYGQTIELDSFVSAHGLDYQKWCDACMGGDPDITRSIGGVKHTAPASEGEPMLPFTDVLKVETMLQGMADLIKLAKWWKSDLPPLRIVP